LQFLLPFNYNQFPIIILLGVLIISIFIRTKSHSIDDKIQTIICKETLLEN